VFFYLLIASLEVQDKCIFRKEYEYAINGGEKEKVLIAGGGPAGWKREVTALRGHEVTLYDKNLD